MSSNAKPTITDDDVDDLDDVLDQFSPPSKDLGVPQTPASPSPLPASSGRPRTNTRVDGPPPSLPGAGAPLDAASEADEDEITKAFTRELEKEMENLVKDFADKMGHDTSKTSDDPKDDEEASKILKAAWEAMLVEGMDSMMPTPGSAPEMSKQQQPETSTPSDFQGKIRQTMEKLKENNAGPESSGNEEDDLQKLLSAALSGLGEGGEGSTEEESELAGFLENMMGQLMSKDVLYEPLKDLEEKFPLYLANPPQALSKDDKEKYEKQLEYVRKIIGVFEAPGYDDKSEESSKVIVELMSEMQAHGSPPKEILGEMPPGFGVGPDSLPDGCVIA